MMSIEAADYQAKAAELWVNFTSKERELVWFGIFPADKLTAAESEGYLTHPLVVALMVHARKVRRES